MRPRFLAAAHYYYHHDNTDGRLPDESAAAILVFILSAHVQYLGVISQINPSNAEATFVQNTMIQRILKTV